MNGALPTFAAWQSVAGGLGLRWRGAELVGPCPSCGGTDRFHVNDRRRGGGAALFGCRRCAGRGAILAAAFPDGTAKSRGASPGSWRGPSRGVPRSDDDRVDAARMWARNARRPAGTPAQRYLASRGVARFNADVRWLPASTWRQVAQGGPYARALPPTGAAGAVLFLLSILAGAGEPRTRALVVEALADDGRRCAWADGSRCRFAVGRLAGAWFRAYPPRHSPALAVCEGPIDALAIAATGTEAWAAGGSSGLPRRADELAATGREIELWPDGDRPGRAAAIRLLAELRGRRVLCRRRRLPDDSDPAQQLEEMS